MNKLLRFIWIMIKWLAFILGLAVIVWVTWLMGQYYAWDWGGFWSNFISNAGSSAVIGVVLYLIITRRDEKNATSERRAKALSMLQLEFRTNLQRVKIYGEALKTPENDLTPLLSIAPNTRRVECS